MKAKKIFHLIGNINDTLIEEARTTKPEKKHYAWKCFTAAAACVVLVIGGVVTYQHNTNKTNGAILDVVFPKAYAFDDYKAKNSTVTNNPVEASFIEVVNQFSYQTASQVITGKDGNINYSPLSLYYALALAASGAEGETADELLSLLGASDKDILSTQCGNLYRRLYTDNHIGKLKIGNSIWMDRSINWKDNFIKNAAENLYASAFNVDFSDNKTGKDIAKWISDNTNGALTPEFNISPKQILSIINTVYFKDEWIDKFNEDKTKEDVFYLNDNTTVKSDFMNSRYDSARFAKGDGFTRSGLGLKNGGRMVFILPDEGISPRQLLSTPEKVKTVFEDGESKSGEVVWQIPKFSFESKLNLTDMLKTSGVNSAFSKNADFSGITDNMAFISNILQETHIAIDEKGVEAAAFTKIDYDGAAQPDGRADMILNRPFIYGITASDGTLLFVGVCDNPTAM